MTKLKDTLMERYVLSKDEVFVLIGELQASDPMQMASASKQAAARLPADQEEVAMAT